MRLYVNWPTLEIDNDLYYISILKGRVVVATTNAQRIEFGRRKPTSDRQVRVVKDSYISMAKTGDRPESFVEYIT